MSNIGTMHSANEILQDLSAQDLSKLVIITMGAGDVYTIHPQLASLITKHEYE
ncbi:MAG: hypothetical protein UZ22_OP11002000080 [Microgenomates bacterium OLB23]|nr:MAG: hypothetical protein UZ22_OP11002000080 [Microgenomates bacterium OLB23]